MLSKHGGDTFIRHLFKQISTDWKMFCTLHGFKGLEKDHLHLLRICFV